MPEYSKIFSYEQDGLSYTISLYEEDGVTMADITVVEGAMDVNAIYFADDDMSGESAALKGPLNMNGASTGDTNIQWDDAQKLSDPGLGAEGDDKPTYIQAGDTLTIAIEDLQIDDIDVIGIRATSTTTDEGSIKAISDDPEEPEPPIDDEDPTFDKVIFGTEFDEDGNLLDGVAIDAEEGGPSDHWLPEGTEPTFENYLSYYENEVPDYDVPSIQTITFYETSPTDGYPVEVFSIEAPEGGFADSEEVLDAYDAAIDSGALEPASSSSELIAAISLLETDEEEPDEPAETEPDDAEDLSMV